MQVSVIVPTFNEADNVVEVIEALRRSLSGISHEIVIVDDDSPDGTWRLAREHSRDDPSVRVIRRIGERGLASAVLAGMAVAEGEALAVIDGDLQHDESVLPQMLRSVLEDGADVCIGTRRGDGGSEGERTRARRLFTAAGTWTIRRLLPALRGASDPLSGFFVVRRDAYERLAPTVSPGLREYKILWAFIGRGRGLNVTEVGYEFRGRAHGETKLSGAVMLDDLANAVAMRSGRLVSPVFLKYCLVGVSGVLVSLAAYGVGEAAGMPRINLGATPELNPIYTSALLGIELSVISNFLANNYLTFYDKRYRGWSLLAGLTLFHAVSLVGVFVQLSVFQLLHRNGLPSETIEASTRAALNNGIGLAVATVTNFALNTSITWRRHAGP